MPEETTGAASTETVAETQTISTTETPKALEKTFTQAELDGIIKQRLARAVPADYDELKARAEKLDALEAGQKTDLEKAVARAERAEAKTTEVETRANSTLKRAAILAEAARQNSADPDVVVALLVNNESITINKEGEVEGTKEAVKALLKEKAYLVKGAVTGASGGQFGGNEQPSYDEQIAAAEKSGDINGAMRLKVAKSQGL